MAKRTRKPPIESDVRQNWFDRHERFGESIRKIASQDGFDVRTVRKHIEMARGEADLREARWSALKDAIQEHYRDLYTFAKRMNSHLNSTPNLVPELKQDPMWKSLREHLPRSIIWRSLEKWEQLRRETLCMDKDFETVVDKWITPRLESHLSSQQAGHKSVLFNPLLAHIREVVRGRQELLQSEKITGNGEPASVDMVRAILNEIATWKEYNEMVQNWNEIRRLEEVLSDELTTIVLRRVVPGKCRYCPA